MIQQRTPTRRTFLASAGLAAVASQTRRLHAFSSLDTATKITRTPMGSLRGEVVDGVRIFRGVPFAEPPVGPLRFKPPVRLKPWSGVRDATHFAASAIQTGEPGISHSEDCLALNIWAPAAKGTHPVLIWIHGGGFTGGHAFDAGIAGDQFAREGIVFITVAYRLGVFGFLDFGPLLGKEYTATANNALRDITTSLEWVHTNIAAFGGDPHRVTVGGESAGGKLTDILMGVPSAQPFFQQMISSSGGAERAWSEADSATAANTFAAEWRKLPGNNVNADLVGLRTAPPMQLIDAQQALIASWPKHYSMRPLRAEVDGVFLPRLPIDTIAAGNTRGKRLLLGTNLDESALFIGLHPAKDATANDLGNILLPSFQQAYAQYKSIYPEFTDEQLRIRAITAEEYWIPSMRVLDAHMKGGGTAFNYRLDFTETSGRFPGYAYHSLDMPLVFDKPHPVENQSSEQALANLIHPAWIAFIQGKTPAAPGLPTWTPYNSATRPTMILNTVSHMQQQPNESELRLWDGVL